MNSKKFNWNCKIYTYKGVYIHQVTKKDYCVFTDKGKIIDALTLKGAKAEIDKLIDEE